MQDTSPDIAIIGSALRLPGSTNGAEACWKAFLDGDWSLASSPPPSSRRLNLGDPRCPDLRGGWLGSAGVEDFDPSFFGIAPEEAKSLRPNCRLGLELSWEALENAGIPPDSLRGRNIAVCVAMGAEDGWDMRRFAEEGSKSYDFRYAQSSDPSAVAGHISHFLDLHGATTVVSGACAGGSLALDYAVRTLKTHDADLAIVGAVTTHFTPAPFMWASEIGALSPTGRCWTFSESADGFCPSEGAIFFVLKRTDAALRDGDVIDTVIRAVKISHNGATKTFTSPNVEAQRSLLVRTMQEAGVAAHDVVYHEAHGTGTLLGDELELEAIRSVYAERKSPAPVLLSSSKTVFGHCQAAAAFVGILKVILCMRHRQIPSHHVSASVDLPEGLIQVPMQATHITEDRRFVATVSSFGITGIISSVILEEPPKQISAPTAPPPLSGEQLLLFSGKDSAGLVGQLSAVLSWTRSAKCTLEQLALLLSNARQHHRVRKAILCSDLSDLNNKILEAIHQVQSHIPRDDSTGNISHSLHHRLISYEAGGEGARHSPTGRQAIPHLLRSFPTYPFQRRRCLSLTGNLASVFVTSSPSAPPTPGGPNDPISSSDISSIVCAALNRGTIELDPHTNIFELGINSLNAIELANSLTSQFSQRITATDLYRLLTVAAIRDFLLESSPLGSDTSFEVEQLLHEFGVPFGTMPHSILGDCRPPTILLTGATGFLGCRLVASLLDIPDITLICLIRGDPLRRLQEKFASYEMNPDTLQNAISASRLRLLPTTDLSHAQLGCSNDNFRMVSRATVVVHCAWKVDFNFAVGGFRADLQATRQLAGLCAQTGASLYFCTSINTTYGYPGVVPERPLPMDVKYALPQGYALSKLAAEHILYRLQAQASFPLRVLRIGQICGDTTSGIWTEEELIPMLISTIPVTGSVLETIPDVCWIPSDVCADTIRDLVAADDSELAHDAILDNQVYNIINPHQTPWAVAVDAIATSLKCPMPRMLSLSQYISELKALPDAPVKRLLPYFMTYLESGEIPSAYAHADVALTVAKSKSLSHCPPIQADFLDMLASKIIARSPVNDISPRSATFAFGPWSNALKVDLADPVFVGAYEELHDMAQKSLRTHLPSYDTSVILSNSPLDHQLRTLAYQLYTANALVGHALSPNAVVGYCFGEFAAAILCGIISRQQAVEFIALRAWAISHVEQCHPESSNQNCKGAACTVFPGTPVSTRRETMLSVVCSADSIRRTLISMPDCQVDVAIIAGQTHVILSGLDEAIARAYSYLQSRNIKCRILDSPIPFHSAHMDLPMRIVAQLLGREPSKPDAAQPPAGPFVGATYISGVTGTALRKESIGKAYWLRHMRDPIVFLTALETVDGLLPDNNGAVVDVGPGLVIRSILKRGLRAEILAAEDLLGTSGSMTTFISQRQISAPSLPPSIPEPTLNDVPPSNIVEPSHLPTTSPSGEGSGQEEKSPITRSSLRRTFLSILSTFWNFPDSESLLQESFQTLGIDSIGFYRLSQSLLAQTGYTFAPSNYTSESSIAVYKLLDRLVKE